MLGKIEGRRRRGWQRTRWLEGITDSMDMSLSKLWKMVKDREAWPAADHGGHKESDTTEQLNNNIGLPSGHVWLWELDGKEGRALKNWRLWTGEDFWESLGQQGDQISQSTLNTCWKDWCWSSSILVIWYEQPTHRKSPLCWERLKAEGEEEVRGWDGWMANFGRWWRTGRPGMLQSMGLQRLGHNWATGQQGDLWEGLVQNKHNNSYLNQLCPGSGLWYIK